MRKYTFNFYASFSMLAVAIAALITLGFQQVHTAFGKAVAQGESIRVTEANACDATTEDKPHFSGCNSII